jgi:hypothetical protein
MIASCCGSVWSEEALSTLCRARSWKYSSPWKLKKLGGLAFLN